MLLTSKPWDSLRSAPPIQSGVWTTKHGARVTLAACDPGVNCRLRIGAGDPNCFASDDLRQLAEFCNELADQLDGSTS